VICAISRQQLLCRVPSLDTVWHYMAVPSPICRRDSVTVLIFSAGNRRRGVGIQRFRLENCQFLVLAVPGTILARARPGSPWVGYTPDRKGSAIELQSSQMIRYDLPWSSPRHITRRVLRSPARDRVFERRMLPWAESRTRQNGPFAGRTLT
jgi:hypothetical protein